MKFTFPWILTAVFACSNALAQPASLERAKIEQIEKLVSAEMSRQNIAGLSAAVAVGRELHWMDGFGFADLENYVPAKSSTVYRWASVSKPVTAVALMQLVEQGKVDLDAPVQRYVPYFPKKQWTATVRDLLCHQGGIRSYRGNEFASTKHYDSLREALGIFQNDPLEYEPKTRFLYSSYGFNLLGAVLEGASSMRFEEYLRKHIFEPAGMRTARADDVYEIIPNRARGYRKRMGGKVENAILIDTSNKVPGGGMCGSVEDIADFGIHLQAGNLLKKETLAEMFTVRTTRDGKPTGYGLGWYIERAGNRAIVYHGGSQPGFRTMLLMIPSDQITVVVMSNIEGSSGLRPLATRIADVVLDAGQPVK